MQIKRAIISVSDKTGVVEFARTLQELKVEILSTGGTAKTLKENGVNVTEISEYTSSPEMMDGRLKTLHPMIHGGILGIRSNESHRNDMAKFGIKPIDMVVVNLYPFEATIAKSDVTLAEAIENIDIGGPTMLRAAAKNYQDVAVVIDSNDYPALTEELKKSGGELSANRTFELAQKVFAWTARYDAAICNYLNAVKDGKKEDVLPEKIAFAYEKAQELRYGENPHLKAAFYREYNVNEPCVAGAVQLHGKELSFNNIMDSDAAIELVKEFKDENFVCILKHTNPCGAATSKKSLLDAFDKAKATDPTSAFGGIIGMNRELDEETATAIADTFFEVVIAPSFSNAALDVLKKKKNIRLLKITGLGGSYIPAGWNTRKVVGGLLVQERDMGSVEIRECKIVSSRKPNDDEFDALFFAWKICKHVKSNAIVFAGADQLLGVGAGQMSRVDSVKIATMKMGESLKSSAGTLVLASDAFFPFRDGVDLAAAVGATAIVQPGGSVRDDEVITAANEHNMAMIFTGMRHFKH